MAPQRDPLELRLRAAVESSPSGLLMVDSAGRIVLVNRQVELLLGFTREELLGQPVEMLVPERYRGQHPAFRTGFLADPRIRAMGHGRDLFALRKDGSEIPVEIGLNPVATDEGLSLSAPSWTSAPGSRPTHGFGPRSSPHPTA